MRALIPGLAILSGLAAAIGCVDAGAHEFWVEPSAFKVEQGGRIGVRLCVGDGYEGWSLARNSARVERFVAAGPSGEQAVVGLDGADPAGAVRLTTPGDYVIAYRSDRAFTEMPATEFDEYLRDKGLDRVAAERRARGGSSRNVREAYSRHSKALIRVGQGAGVPLDRPMRLPLEIVAEAGSSRASADGWRSFRLLHEGRPLAGALVAALRPGTADPGMHDRTDADGRVGFRLSAAGPWRIAAVHMNRAPRGVDADWESLWASLTFELPAAATATAPQHTRAAACRNRVAASLTAAAR